MTHPSGERLDSVTDFPFLSVCFIGGIVSLFTPKEKIVRDLNTFYGKFLLCAGAAAIGYTIGHNITYYGMKLKNRLFQK
jgi:hypothetical protein